MNVVKSGGLCVKGSVRNSLIIIPKGTSPVGNSSVSSESPSLKNTLGNDDQRISYSLRFPYPTYVLESVER
jgi:hypothetical protein